MFQHRVVSQTKRIIKQVSQRMIVLHKNPWAHAPGIHLRILGYFFNILDDILGCALWIVRLKAYLIYIQVKVIQQNTSAYFKISCRCALFSQFLKLFETMCAKDGYALANSEASVGEIYFLSHMHEKTLQLLFAKFRMDTVDMARAPLKRRV